MVRLPPAIMGAVLALLVAITVLRGDWEQRRTRPQRPATPVAAIARHVETIRGRRYTRIPRATYVTAAEAKREATADVARPAAARALDADGALYGLLGLVPAGTDLREVTTGLFDGAVAGYYDPRDGRLRVIRSAATSNRAIGEVTLAHELTHALDDQTFGLDTGKLDGGGDAALAYTAMVEGSATASMVDYQRRFVPIGDTLGSLGSAFGPTGTEDLPPFLTAQLLFPYLDGLKWITALRAKGGWPLVDLAFRDRPPASTEQVLHPDKWLADERPALVSTPMLDDGAGRLVTRQTLGEWQTRQLLATGGAADPQGASEGWGGDSVLMVRSGTGPCRAPCTVRDTLVARWAWDSPRDAQQFVTALRQAARELYGDRSGAYRVIGGRTPALVLAPTRPAAAAIALAVPGGDAAGAK